MRAGPIGLARDIEWVKSAAAIQAKVTHDTRGGVDSAVVAALTVHYFFRELGEKKKLGDFLNSHVSGPWRADWYGKVGSKGLMSVHAAVTALRRNTSLSGLLRDCISFQGDVDTVATIALGAAACSNQFNSDLPDSLYEGFESGPFGLQFLKDLDARLLAWSGNEKVRTT